MALRIQLDRPHAHFTNLDFITGKVILHLHNDTSISSVVVKLEGESMTRLAAPKYPGADREKMREEIEVHKIPFNNNCTENVPTGSLPLPGLRLEVNRDMNTHVRKALPPSLVGFPGEAEIRYYVKATIARPQFYKENYRAFTQFKFLPIEPPRQPDLGQETYARRQHQFSKVPYTPDRKGGGFFRKSSQPSLLDLDGEPPRFSVDARLPSPPIITCNEPLPLRILVKKLNDSSETVFLQMIQIELIGYTNIRAHDLRRPESVSWVILSQSNMNLPLGDGSDPAGKEWVLDANMWKRIPLPNSVAPSFDTCNIARSYDLEVRVGLTHGSGGIMKPELSVLPLRMSTQVFSGIAPPQALLDAVRRSPSKAGKVPDITPPPPQPPRPQPAQAAPQYPPTQPDEFEDAPPSYEDAMAEALGPVDGPRREYNPPDTGSSWPGTDTKGPATNNQDDDRLFPNSSVLNANNTSTDSFDVFAAHTPVDGYHSNDTKNSHNPYFQGDQSQGSATFGQSQTVPVSVPEPESEPPPPPPQPPRPRPTPYNMGVPSRKPVPGSRSSSMDKTVR
ncbi:hypothetical protein FQN53_007531 [Emmonsiellopsis sp. PD_33]|nr:hypothetical protein FQN53_007531 [Emmonsiellopsis sp. PD_33]